MSFFVHEIIDEEAGNYFELTGMGYGVLIAAMLVILVAACFFSGARRFRTKQLVFSAMAMALAMVTSMIKLIDMPMGGSVTLFSMLFICLVGYWYGPGAGLMTAVAYGILQFVTNPYMISIPQVLTDYIFAFGALGLSGIFSRSKHGLLKGYLLGVFGRFIFTFLSGMIFFGSYAAGYNMTAFAYSFAYNGAYLGAEALLTVILISLPPVRNGLDRIKGMALE